MLWISGSTIDPHFVQNFSSIARDDLSLQRYIKRRDQANILVLKSSHHGYRDCAILYFGHFSSNSFVTDRKIFSKLHCFQVLILYLHNLSVSESYVMTERSLNLLGVGRDQ